jgi:hypothetical protein
MNFLQFGQKQEKLGWQDDIEVSFLEIWTGF